MPTSEHFARITMIGLGYIGLPTAAVMASRGLQVVGVDIDEQTIETINAGKVPIVEPDLDIVVRSVVTTGNLRATRHCEPADAFLIAVPTPFKHEHKPDLSYIEAAASALAPLLRIGNLVVLESTSPVGTTELLARWLAALRPDLHFPDGTERPVDVNVAYCPERVLPGSVLQELVNNDRIIGGLSEQCSEQAARLYKTFVRGECLLTNARTAELCKLTENAYRDVNIGFANEMSLVCDHLQVNVWDLIALANRHPRVDILKPGPGVGGHCIAVDPWFLIDSAPEQTHLIRTARLVNDAKPEQIVQRVASSAGKFRQPTIACFGLAFKADIDDLRQSPALDIVQALARRTPGRLLVVEPHVKALPDALASDSNVSLVSAREALSHADIVLGLVDHTEFRALAIDDLSEKIVFDTRGMWR